MRPLRALETLKLTGTVSSGGWDKLGNDDEGRPRFTNDYLTLQTNKRADKVFNALAPSCPRFLALVFEYKGVYRYCYQLCGRYCTCDEEEAMLELAYLRARQVDLYGQWTVVGVRVEPHMVKHHVPYTDVLEPERFITL